MVRSPLSAREPNLEGLSVLVIGLGLSGLAAVRLAAAKGARVLAADLRSEDALGSAAESARKVGAEIHAGGHPRELAEGADLVVVSPGVPMDAPVILEARRREIPVWGEIELAWRFCRGRVLAVTGSNGKSTVTSMSGTILRAAGFPGGAGGNLGVPLADLLDTDGPDAVHAVELSSFQLEAIDRFSPHVALVLNITPDHLDRYASYEDYVRAKARVLEAQGPEGFAILNSDDPGSAHLPSSVRGRLFRFSTRSAVDEGAWLREGSLVLRIGGREESLMEGDELPVPGEHNRANALAAALACRLMGCSKDAIVRGLLSYRALPHRLEKVAEHRGVTFYDDSKATNLDSAMRALTSFGPGSVHAILGGRDKGADWAALAQAVRRHARRVLLVGEAAGTIREHLADIVPLVDCETVPEAVRVGARGANPGEVVLLAPGCASFDQYRNFEERGDDFRRAVVSLIREGDRHA